MVTTQLSSWMGSSTVLTMIRARVTPKKMMSAEASWKEFSLGFSSSALARPLVSCSSTPMMAATGSLGVKRGAMKMQ